MSEKSTKFTSSLGIKYPSHRDEPLKTGLRWLKGKRADDGAEGLWRIHDKLYDLNEFIQKHPGGAEWIELTQVLQPSSFYTCEIIDFQGTDITEAFETHHLTSIPEKLLQNLFIRRAKTPRNSPFTFKEGGFYKTMKRNIAKKLADVPKAPAERSKKIADFLLTTYIVLALMAAFWRSFTCGMLSGIFLSLTAIAAHNFFHQKDNFRMYYFNFTLLEYK